MIQVMQIIVFDIGLGEYDHHQKGHKNTFNGYQNNNRNGGKNK